MINRVQTILVNYSCTLLIDPEVAGSEIVEGAKDVFGIFESKSAYVSRYFKELIKALEAKEEFDDLAEDLVEILMKDATTSYENQANNMVSQKFRHQRLMHAFVMDTMTPSSSGNLISLSSGLPKHYHDLVSICKSKKICNVVSNSEMFLPSEAARGVVIGNLAGRCSSIFLHRMFEYIPTSNVRVFLHRMFEYSYIANTLTHSHTHSLTHSHTHTQAPKWKARHFLVYFYP